MLEELVASIENDAHELAEKIREYSRSQKALWRSVPALALEADGRNGYSELYQIAFSRGYWMLNKMHADHFHEIAVDLSNGELIDPYLLKGPRPASDSQVLYLASHLQELDAGEIVTGLQKEADKPYAVFYGDGVKNDESREENRKRYRVPQLFSRRT